MIQCEGYKAFRGSATIKPKDPSIKPFVVEGDWLYKKEYDCWYCNGRSFPAGIVTEIHEPYMEYLVSIMYKARDIEEDANLCDCKAIDIHERIESMKQSAVEIQKTLLEIGKGLHP